MAVEQKQSIVVFFSYAKRDKSLRDHLEEHLSNLKYRGVITTWHDREVLAGMDWLEQVDNVLRSARIILLLISSAFMASDYCYGKEMQEALQLHTQKRAAVIPILLRPVIFTDAPFSRLSMLPANGKPVTQWRNRDSAFVDVVLSIEKVIQQYASLPERASPSETIHPDAPVPGVSGSVEESGRCPYCGAATRPEDNFCLNCGNRLPPSETVRGMSSRGASAAPTIAAYEASVAAPAIEQPARLTLRDERGEMLEDFTLNQRAFTIGRAPSNNLSLSKDALISRHHAVIRYEDDAYFLSDKQSANGTFVNGQELEEGKPYKLQHGDYVGIGSYNLIFTASDADSKAMPILAVPIEDLPMVNDSTEMYTYHTRSDAAATADSDEFEWHPSSAGKEKTRSVSEEAPAHTAPWDGTLRGLGEPTEALDRLIFEATQRAYYTESVAAYEEALTKNPDDNTALLGLGKALCRLGRYSEAFDVFRRSLLSQETASAYAGLGDIYMRRQQFAQAVAAYEKGLQLDADVALNYANFIYALHMVGRVDEAAHIRERAEAIGYFDDEGNVP